MLLSACSLVFVREPTEAALRDPKVAPDCTTSNAVPLVDLGLGLGFAAGVGGATYAATKDFNKDCTNCIKPWTWSLLSAFLVGSPWLITSAIGFSDTSRCRKLYRARGVAY